MNQGPSTMALGVNMLLAAFPGARLVSYRVRCQLHLDVPGRGRVIEGEAVLVLPPVN